MRHQRDQPKGWVAGLVVDNEVYVYRNGKRIVVERYDKEGRKIWDERRSNRRDN